MINRLPLILVILVSSFILTNCKKEPLYIKLDLQQLYSLQYSKEYKDSLSTLLFPRYEKAMELTNTYAHRIYIDSLLSEMRWSNDTSSFVTLAEKALQFAHKSKDDYYAARIYNQLGVFYRNTNKFDSVYSNYSKAAIIYRALGDSIKVAETAFYKGRVLYEKGLSYESDNQLSIAILLLSKYPNNPVLSEAKLIKALNLSGRKDYIGAINYLNSALLLVQNNIIKQNILSESQTNLIQAVMLGNLSTFYYDIGRFEKASECADKAFEHLNAIEDYKDEDIVKSLIGFLNICKIKANFSIHPSQDGINKVIEAFKADSVVNYTHRMYDSSKVISELYNSENNFTQAKKWIDKAYQIALDNNLKPELLKIIDEVVTESQSDFIEKEIVINYINANNDLQQNEAAIRNSFSRIIFTSENALAENTILKHTILIIGFTSIVSFLFLLLISTFFRFKSKTKELNFVKNEKEYTEHINELLLEKNRIEQRVKYAERDRIAKDLHDNITSSIFTIRFNLEMLETTNIIQKNMLVQELQKVEKNTRDLAHALKESDFFATITFKQAITNLLYLLNTSHKTKFDLSLSQDVNIDSLSVETKIHLYYIIKEACTNAYKYANASVCNIIVTKKDAKILMKIIDNGIGINKNEDLSNGIGIDNMKDRAKLINATVNIISKSDGGTEISIAFFK